MVIYMAVTSQVVWYYLSKIVIKGLSLVLLSTHNIPCQLASHHLFMKIIFYPYLNICVLNIFLKSFLCTLKSFNLRDYAKTIFFPLRKSTIKCLCSPLGTLLLERCNWAQASFNLKWWCSFLTPTYIILLQKNLNTIL